MATKNTLTPPDFNQCQAEITTTLGAFVLGGPPKTKERCKNKPTMLATESQPGADGQRGSMAICDSCFAVMQKQVYFEVHYRRITAEEIKMDGRKKSARSKNA